MNLIDEIPGYREALESEQSARELAFLCVPEFICGIDVVSLTPRRLSILDGANSAFVTGGDLTVEEVAKFLWIVSTQFHFGESWEKRRFIKRCRKLDFLDAVTEINRYLDETFADADSGGGGGIPIVSRAASIVHLCARTYGWDWERTIDTPLKILFQLTRLIHRESDRRAIFFNRSDRIRGEWLKQMNESKQENN